MRDYKGYRLYVATRGGVRELAFITDDRVEGITAWSMVR